MLSISTMPPEHAISKSSIERLVKTKAECWEAVSNLAVSVTSDVE
jgi:hypothetical protein